MMEEVIRAEGLVKQFRILHDPPLTLQKLFYSAARGKRWYELFTALDNVSFSVKQGETVGLVGPNASGKTTLLRLIAGIYKPDKGRVFVRGRVAPYLELGAGFAPEFTGLENLSFYAVLFGLGRRRLKERLSSIIEFSGLEGFLDVPVRQYSFGMRMRLAFSLAVSIDPRIMLIDEMLAVGDLAFREKCFARIAELKAAGVTLVLVSHQMEEIERLCDRVIFLEKGRIAGDGNPQAVIAEYRKRATR